MDSGQKKAARKQGEQQLYGALGGCLNIIVFIVVIICLAIGISAW